MLLECACCHRRMPREAIAFVRKRPMASGPHKGQSPAFCGECYHSGQVWRGDWTW